MKYPFPEELVKQIKEEICKEAREMRQINQTAPVSGERLSIKRPDRETSIVLYGSAVKRTGKPSGTDHVYL